jgi:hypothetical protein
VKAITIKNSWALLIAAGIKDIENRTWRTMFRGRIYIHCSAKPAFTELQSCLTYHQWEKIPEANQINLLTDIWPTSAIIGKVDLINCVINHPSIWAEKTGPFDKKPIWNWVLANPELYDKPIENVKGKLSFWEYRNDLDYAK